MRNLSLSETAEMYNRMKGIIMTKEVKEFGRKDWFFPDADLPPEGEGELKGHESIIVLNPNEKIATITIKCYFEHPKQPFLLK